MTNPSGVVTTVVPGEAVVSTTSVVSEVDDAVVVVAAVCPQAASTAPSKRTTILESLRMAFSVWVTGEVKAPEGWCCIGLDSIKE